ncbi:alpha/beta-hydrolase [Rhizodiscina lignyota]|uniref:Carboxypeptidase n=1 Tax=Rhizodiscina lignyota TaxID=1504668 RepID=A0A9P4IGD4_9PEZI|nr:alpha/beta-hydrolase [Rhizodiscina lignyota]
MKLSLTLSLFALTSIAAARSPQHVGKRNLPAYENRVRRSFHSPLEEQKKAKRQSSLIPQTTNTTKFAVDGTAIPDVDFDIGESYAGLLPISSAANASELYFWFFPTDNPDGKDDLTIWLNGGPGCSSLEGLLQENGPFIWQYGTFKPVKNPYTWVNLTNMVWVEQPVGTGFSQGTTRETNEEEVAEHFLGFFKNFVDTFGLHGKTIHISGESYAGYYVPYIADAMINAKDTTYFDIHSIMIHDPSTSYNAVQEQIPVVPLVDANKNLFNLNATTLDYIHSKHESCGYAAFLDEWLQFPPPGVMPHPPGPTENDTSCDLWDYILNAALETNPCFDIYQIATTCPVLWDVLGFPGSFDYLPAGAQIYFNRSDVQKAINAPAMEWEECTNGVLDTDTSLQSGLSVLPHVIENLDRTIIAHGNLDYILIANGTLLMIQNMTFNGAQGFSSVPSDPFFVPYHSELSDGTLAAAGVMGTTHTERGLTWVEVALSGHMIPQYQPSASYRTVEYMLGRIDSLTEVSDFTTQTGDFGNDASLLLGNGGIGSDFGGNKTKRMNRRGHFY